jgi:D-arabinose 1-dehydrogenase-like Zn-dependent alcohol dehydrogenase
VCHPRAWASALARTIACSKFPSAYPANVRQHLYEALDYVAKGMVKVMTETFLLEDVTDAYNKVVRGEVRFGAVIKPKN